MSPGIRRIALVAAGCAVSLFAPRALPGAAVATAVALSGEPCEVAGRAARCGSVDVDEGPGSTRRLSLRFALLTPTGDVIERDPVMVLEGGPGASLLRGAAIHANTFSRVLQSRGLLLIDQRGTGESNGLTCSAAAAGWDALDNSALSRCVDELGARADLRYYTTPIAVGDLAVVLDALDIPRVNVFGVSYGTRTALVFARRFPERVRSLALLGTYPVDRNAVADAPRILEDSFAVLVALCSRDPECRASFPDLANDWRVLAERGPQLFGERWPTVASTLRLASFYPLLAAQLPAVVQRAAAGERGAPQALVAATQGAFAGIDLGAFLSILCNEDVARLNWQEVTAAARGTVLGTSWAEGLRERCAAWPQGSLSGDYWTPFVSDLPLLSMTGERDPAMPPSWGEELAASWPNARHLTLPAAPHGLLGMRGVGCVIGLLERFIAGADAAALDAACLSDLSPPPWAKPLSAVR